MLCILETVEQGAGFANLQVTPGDRRIKGEFVPMAGVITGKTVVVTGGSRCEI